MSKIECTSIGFVSNQVTDPVDENWGSVISRLCIKPEYAKGIKGINQFSHVIVITFLDQAEFDVNKHLIRRPRGLSTMPEVGIFSQRAKDRPNPIGITTVRIESVARDYVEVRGLDAINGTPILDIKPYYPHYDFVKDATVPEWVDRLMQDYF